uniref:Uncharacterized protein n=1 Tax=Aegilops tauschii TaxID=37682 RepID=M8CFQ8_AEGTA
MSTTRNNARAVRRRSDALATSVMLGCRYFWEHHRRRGRCDGISRCQGGARARDRGYWWSTTREREILPLHRHHDGLRQHGQLPIAIIGSVCHTADHPFGPGCHREGIAYVSFAQWVAVLLVYTLVYHMMEPPMQYYEIVGEGNEIEEEPQLSNFSRPLLQEAEWPGMADKETEHSKTPFIARIFASISGSSQNTFPDIDFSEEGGVSGAGPSSPKSLRCLAEPKVVRRMRVVAEKTPIQHVLQPPTIASLLAIIIGMVPVLKAFVFGADAPLSFFTDSLEILAAAVVPSVMLILGGMLAEGPNDNALGMRTIVGITVARLLILPCIGIGIVMLADRLHLLVENDHMYRFVLSLQYSTPSAILLGAIASLRGYSVKEASALLFWQHICAVWAGHFILRSRHAVEIQSTHCFQVGLLTGKNGDQAFQKGEIVRFESFHGWYLATSVEKLISARSDVSRFGHVGDKCKCNSCNNLGIEQCNSKFI